MTRLTWEDRPYEIGLDRGVYFPQNGPAEVWNGLRSVVESPSGDVSRVKYIDGVGLRKPSRRNELTGTIEAFSTPGGFFENISQDRPKEFGLSYRVRTAKGYRIHILYNVLIQPSEHTYQYDEVEPFSWEFTTRAVPVPGLAPSAHLILESEATYSWTLEAVENVLYGSDTATPRLPMPQELFEIFEENSILRVIDHGDGTFTIEGPDDAIIMLDPTTFEVTWPSVTILDANTYNIRSL